MIVAGITGGIGSGKTSVCKFWEKLDAVVVYADDLAKKLMVQDDELKKKLVTLFGKNTYNQDGSLNKPHLIEQAFEKGRVNELNSVVHPTVKKAFADICRSEQAKGTKLVVKEAALMLQDGRPKEFDCVVLVLSNQNKRLSRVQQRDQTSEQEIIARMDKQPDFDQLTHLADYVIHNNGTLPELEQKSKELYHKIIAEKG